MNVDGRIHGASLWINLSDLLASKTTLSSQLSKQDKVDCLILIRILKSTQKQHG